MKCPKCRLENPRNLRELAFSTIATMVKRRIADSESVECTP